MKKLLLLLLFVFLIPYSLLLKAQEWFPVGAKWTYGWAEHGCVNPSISHYYPDTYEVEKDTIVLGKACRKIKRLGQPNWYGNSETFVFDSAGKVYYFPPFDFVDTREEWSLLYDLTKNKGDTIWYPNMRTVDWNTGDTVMYYNVVDTIFEVKVNGQYLTTMNAPPCWQLDPNSPWLWTSLGSYITEILSGGMIGTGTHWAGGCQYPNGLRCYEDSSFGYWKNPFFNLSCDTSYSINTSLEYQVNSKSISIFPNPTSYYLNIQIKDISFEDLNLKIFDLNANLQMQSKISQEIQKIDISDLMPGMYIYEIESEGQFYRNKLIIE